MRVDAETPPRISVTVFTGYLGAKGIVDIDGDDFRLVFHAVVFIGRHLDPAAMQAGFAACATPADHPARGDRSGVPSYQAASVFLTKRLSGSPLGIV